MTMKVARRSGLTMPVNTRRFVDRAWTRGCDFINLDLEDSVPESQKPHARTLVKEALSTVAKGGAEVFVRLNHDYVRADLESVVWPGLKRVNYPKAETAEEIHKLDVIITELERQRGIRPGTVEIGTAIETARGVANAYQIATSSPRIVDFGGGTGYDMSRDLGVEMFVGFDQFVYGKGELELAARALELEVLAAPYVANLTGSVGDPDRAFLEAEAARKCGLYHGSGLHPNVVEPQNRGFTPSAEEVEGAHTILERFQQVQTEGKLWDESGEPVIDKYEARRATQLIEWAHICAEKDRTKAVAVALTQAEEGT